MAAGGKYDIDEVISALEFWRSAISRDGQWFASGNQIHTGGNGEMGKTQYMMTLVGGTPGDATFLAAAHRSTPELIAEIRRLRKLLQDNGIEYGESRDPNPL